MGQADDEDPTTVSQIGESLPAWSWHCREGSGITEFVTQIIIITLTVSSLRDKYGRPGECRREGQNHHEGASEEAPIKLRPKDKEELTQQRG